ncbi:hypothetical protein [Cellulomonas sp.]|uniref:hypothetical protein n=1 Tax=Cellulomonas sp. TaxID=40001 RepID=UPI001B0FA1AC|nr:hypothetical protein [Cellulomonas sp.]MBO9553604.1 hypothetical protein [Cellulomonas sp.]
MSEHLRVDTRAVRMAGVSLRTVAAEFDDANAHSDRVADAVGGGPLGDCLHDFAHEWDDARARMVEQIAALAEVCEQIAVGFDGLDAQFATVLRGDA